MADLREPNGSYDDEIFDVVALFTTSHCIVDVTMTLCEELYVMPTACRERAQGGGRHAKPSNFGDGPPPGHARGLGVAWQWPEPLPAKVTYRRVVRFTT